MLPKLVFIRFLLIIYTSLAHADEQSFPTLLGASAQIRPAYDGSRSTKVDLIPVLMYYESPWFVRTTEGILEAGVKTALSGDFNFGIQAAHEDGRFRHDADFLNTYHVPNLDDSLSVGGFLQYEKNIKSVPIDILARYRKDIDSSRGDQIDLRITAGIYGSKDKRLNAEIFAQTSWANSKAMQSYYGVTDYEAASTGLSAFKPSAGSLSNQIGFWCSYNLGSHWILLGNAERHQLEGDAKNSPLTQVRYNNYFSLGVAYQY